MARKISHPQSFEAKRLLTSKTLTSYNLRTVDERLNFDGSLAGADKLNEIARSVVALN